MYDKMFSATLHPSKTTIQDITIYEPVDVVALEKLLKSDLLRTTFNNKVAGAIYDSERQQLKAYAKLIDDEHAKVTYKKKSAYGRSNPKKGLGLFNIRREVRQTLVKHCMVDIDIQNCHLAILEQVCIRFGVPCDHLTHYNNHRDAILTETMKTYGVDRDTAKRIFIVATYCGNFLLEDQAPSPFYVQFVDQMRRIAKRIADENPDIQSMVRELKEDDHGYVYNFHGKCLSYYLQELEHQILNKTYLFLVQKQVIQGNVCSLQADGIMVRRDHYYPGVLGELTDHIQAELGMQLTFVEKAMEQDYLGSLDDHGVLNVAPRLKRNVEKLTRLPDVVGCHPYASDLCTEDHVLNHSDVILQSCCGTGKTYAVAKALQHLNKTHKIVSIVNRQSLITAQMEHFSHFGIQMNSYLDKENFSLHQHAVICVNSLMKYKRLQDSDFRNFVLYIDEVQSLCETLTHSQLLLKDVKIVWNVLVRMVKHCHKLVVSDHTITKSVLDLINIRKTPTKASIYIRNTYQKFRDTPAHLVRDEHKFKQRIRDKMQTNEGFWAGFDSARVAEEYYYALKDCTALDCVLVTSETQETIPKDLSVWKDKCIFYSPRIETGVDFSIDTSQSVFFHMKGDSVLPTSVFQMICRTRNMKDLTWFAREKKDKPFRYQSRSDCLEQLKASQTVTSFHINCQYLDSEDNIQYSDNTFKKLYVGNEFLKDTYDSNKEEHLKHILSENGFVCTEDLVDAYRAVRKCTETQQKIETGVEANFDEWMAGTRTNENFDVRKNTLKLLDPEALREHSSLIKDQRKYERHLMTILLLKDRHFVETKLKKYLEHSFADVGIQNIYTKIHLLFTLEREAGTGRFQFGQANVENLKDRTWEMVKQVFRKTVDKPKNQAEFAREYASLVTHLQPSLIKRSRSYTRVGGKRESHTEYEVNADCVRESLKVDLYREDYDDYDKGTLRTLKLSKLVRSKQKEERRQTEGEEDDGTWVVTSTGVDKEWIQENLKAIDTI